MERFGITVDGQLAEAIRFAAVGILLAVWYDVFRLIRVFSRPNAVRIFIEDLLYGISAAAVTLLASLPICHGHIRFFHFPALIIGFLCYYHTVGRLFFSLANRLRRQIGDLWEKGKNTVKNFAKKEKNFEKSLETDDTSIV